MWLHIVCLAASQVIQDFASMAAHDVPSSPLSITVGYIRICMCSVCNTNIHTADHIEHVASSTGSSIFQEKHEFRVLIRRHWIYSILLNLLSLHSTHKSGVNRNAAWYNAWQARNDHTGLSTKDRGTGETCDVIAI